MRGRRWAQSVSISELQSDVTTKDVGNAASVFPFSLIVPLIQTSATVRLQQYAADEHATSRLLTLR